jgi:hypothetical protein
VRARARQKEIRTNPLIFPNFRFRKQGKTGWSRQVGNEFAHRRVSQRQGREPLDVCSLFIPVKAHPWSVVPQANFRRLWVANYRCINDASAPILLKNSGNGETTKD